MSEWIPVEQRPDDIEWHIVLLKNGVRIPAYWDSRSKRWNDRCDTPLKSVVAWLPNPKENYEKPRRFVVVEVLLATFGPYVVSDTVRCKDVATGIETLRAAEIIADAYEEAHT